MSDTHRVTRRILESVTEDARLLVEQTGRLARAEATVAVRSTAFYVSAAAAGALVAVGGLLVLLAAAVLSAVALGLPPWAAALAVGLFLLAAGTATAYFCIGSLGRVEFDLRHTRRSITETIAWLKTQLQ